MVGSLGPVFTGKGTRLGSVPALIGRSRQLRRVMAAAKCRAHERSFVMFKYLLAKALGLASSGGFALGAALFLMSGRATAEDLQPGSRGFDKLNAVQQGLQRELILLEFDVKALKSREKSATDVSTEEARKELRRDRARLVERRDDLRRRWKESMVATPLPTAVPPTIAPVRPQQPPTRNPVTVPSSNRPAVTARPISTKVATPVQISPAPRTPAAPPMARPLSARPLPAVMPSKPSGRSRPVLR